MALTVKAASYLQQRMPGKRAEMSVDFVAPCTLAELLARLGVPSEKIGVVRVNLQTVGTDHQLADGDLVELFPRIGGG